jgi:hypothetical protein
MICDAALRGGEENEEGEEGMSWRQLEKQEEWEKK